MERDSLLGCARLVAGLGNCGSADNADDADGSGLIALESDEFGSDACPGEGLASMSKVVRMRRMERIERIRLR